MTEEEAKTKTCHKTLAPFAGCEQTVYSPASCLGSQCMAWRWHGVLSDGKRHMSPEAAYAAQNPGVPSGSGGMNEGDIPLGYCGDAGRP